MKHYSSGAARRTDEPEPAWEVARLFPPQGQWSEADYLALDGNRMVELSRGVLEVLPMPTTSHQVLVAYLYGLLATFVAGRDLGAVLFAPLRVRLWRNKIREPDVVFMSREHAERIGEKYWNGADMVMEVVSAEEEDRLRDLVKKRTEYAKAGIPEYWIVDPLTECIMVLHLAGKTYAVHGEFPKGTTASSRLLPGFIVDVTEAFSHRLGAPAAPKTARKPRRSRKGN